MLDVEPLSSEALCNIVWCNKYVYGDFLEFSEDNSIARALLRSYSIFDFVHGIHIGIELWEEYVLKALFYCSKIILELPILIRIFQNLSQIRKIKKNI